MKCFNELLFTHFRLVAFNLQIIPRINNSINGAHPKLEEALMARGAKFKQKIEKENEGKRKKGDKFKKKKNGKEKKGKGEKERN